MLSCGHAPAGSTFRARLLALGDTPLPEYFLRPSKRHDRIKTLMILSGDDLRAGLRAGGGAGAACMSGPGAGGGGRAPGADGPDRALPKGGIGGGGVEGLAGRDAAGAVSLETAPAGATGLLDVFAQALVAVGVPQFAQSLGFDLADAFAGDAELLADLFEGAAAAVVESEAQA